MARIIGIKGFDCPCPFCGKVTALFLWLHCSELIRCAYCKETFLPDQLPRKKAYRALRAWLLTAPNLTLEE